MPLIIRLYALVRISKTKIMKYIQLKTQRGIYLLMHFSFTPLPYSHDI